MMYDVIIIGAGASGLLCAITAAQRGRKILVLDSSNKIGKKILMSGGGRCNFTNLNIQPDCFLSSNPHFCKSALSRYTQFDFINLVEKHGIAYEERDYGQLFCIGSAKEILAMLLEECEQASVKIRNHCEISSVKSLKKDDETKTTFKLESSLGKFESQSLVVATGGLSIPKMGATNFSYKLAEKFNIPVLPTRAGLVPFTFSDHYKIIFERLSGVSQEVILYTINKQFHENILFTHRGLSGPAALQLSNYWNVGESIYINLFPNDDLAALLNKTKKDNPKSLLHNFFSKYLVKKLVQELETLFWIDWHDKYIADMPDKILDNVAMNLSAWELKPSGTEGY